MKLNLDAKTNEERKVKAYLEANASKILAEKINNGVRIQKDGKTLLNKKTLAGFMKFACDEAKKQAEKGAQSACIDDDVVYGWAVHYFEEPIEGTLYNEDGTEYKKQPGVTVKTPTVKYTPPKPQPKPQLSMFDMLGNGDNSGISAAQPQDTDEDITDDEPTEEEREEIFEQLSAEQPPKKQLTDSPLWQRYRSLQEKYPDCIIAYRVGDFYEVFGESAKVLAEILDLTLTGRDCGLKERVPMVGFPYCSAEAYIAKAVKNGAKIVTADPLGEEKTYFNQPCGTKQNIDLETGEILHEETNEPDLSAFDPEALAILDELLGNEITLR